MTKQEINSSQFNEIANALSLINVDMDQSYESNSMILQLIRKNKKMSQFDVAEQLGITQSYYSKLERIGNLDALSLCTFARLLEILELQPTDFFKIFYINK